MEYSSMRSHCKKCNEPLTKHNCYANGKSKETGDQLYRSECADCYKILRNKRLKRRRIDIVENKEQAIERAIKAQRSIFKTTLLVAA